MSLMGHRRYHTDGLKIIIVNLFCYLCYLFNVTIPTYPNVVTESREKPYDSSTQTRIENCIVGKRTFLA